MESEIFAIDGELMVGPYNHNLTYILTYPHINIYHSSTSSFRWDLVATSLTTSRPAWTPSWRGTGSRGRACPLASPSPSLWFRCPVQTLFQLFLLNFDETTRGSTYRNEQPKLSIIWCKYYLVQVLFGASIFCHQEGLATGRLAHWTKGFKCSDVEVRRFSCVECSAANPDINLDI